MYFFFFLASHPEDPSPQPTATFFFGSDRGPGLYVPSGSFLDGRRRYKGPNQSKWRQLCTTRATGHRARKTSSSVNPEFGISLRAAKAEPTTNSTPPAHLPRPERRFNCAPAKNPSITNALVMALSCRYAAQSCARQLRSSSSLRASTTLFQTRTPATARRHNSTEAAAPTNPKIAAIVDQISTLTLLETADLVSSLKVS